MWEGIVATVTSGKGGVGKSTFAANFAVALADLEKKVLLIDFDIGLRNLDMILGLENRVVYNIIDVLNGNVSLEQAIIKDKKNKLLNFLPASQKDDKTALDKKKVEELILNAKKKYDYIVIDSPAGIEEGFENSIYMADMAFVVVNPEVSSIRDADRAIGIIDSKSKKSAEGKDVNKYIVINRYDQKMADSGNIIQIEDIEDILALPLASIIPADDGVIQSTNEGVPIYYNKNSQFRESILSLVNRIENDEVEIIDPQMLLPKEKGFVGKLFGNMFKGK